MSEPDVFDIIAKRIVETHNVPKRISPSLAKHFANELRHVDERAREGIQSELRRLLNVPSEEDVHRIADTYVS